MNTNTYPQLTSMLLDIPQLPVTSFDNSANAQDDRNVTRLQVGLKSGLPKPRAENGSAGRSGVTSGTLKRIRHELDNDDLDMRVVITTCRGLRRGTSRFEEAYITGRLDTLTQKRQSHTGIPHMIFAEDPNTLDPFGTRVQPASLPQVAGNPFSVFHLGHLINFFGPWLAVLLACQFFTAWVGSAWLDRAFEGGRYFYTAMILLTFLSLNSYVWFSKQGKHYSEFMKPGIILLSVSLLACISLHLLNTVARLI